MQRSVSDFRPKFLLGLTATPERMDNNNIYEICDYNVPYEISLKAKPDCVRIQVHSHYKMNIAAKNP